MSYIEAKNQWELLGLPNHIIQSPHFLAFEIPAEGQVTIPSENHVFNADQGILTVFYAIFDHPSCGIRIENPDFDTRETYTVINYSIGSSPFDQTIYVMMPPTLPPGMYAIKRCTDWIWREWLRLHVINEDTAIHHCLGYGYTIHVLNERVALPIPVKKGEKGENIL